MAYPVAPALMMVWGSTSGAYFFNAGMNPFWKVDCAIDMASDPARYWQKVTMEVATAIAAPVSSS